MEENKMFDFFNPNVIPEGLRIIDYINLNDLAEQISTISSVSKKVEILKESAAAYIAVIENSGSFLCGIDATPQEHGMCNSYNNPDVLESPDNIEQYNFGILQTRKYYHLLDCISDLENGNDISGIDLIVGINYRPNAETSKIKEIGLESIFKSKRHLKYAINVGADSVKVNDGRFETIFTHKLEYTHRQERARLKAWWFALKKSNYLRPEFLALSFEDISRLLDDYFIFESPLSKTGHFFKDPKCEDLELERVYANILSSKVF